MNKIILLAAGAIMLTASSWALTEDELVISTVEAHAETNMPLSLTTLWDIREIVTLGVRYSSVGWDLDPVSTGDGVRLTLIPLLDGVEVPEQARVLATGLTGRGTYDWTPTDMMRRQYVLRHEVLSGETVVAAETLNGRFTFENCEFETLTEDDMISALGRVTQPYHVTNDVVHGWKMVNKAGDGLKTPTLSDGQSAQLDFYLAGAGTFYIDVALDMDAGTGSVALVADGETVTTVTEACAATTLSAAFAEDGDHRVSVVFANASGAAKAVLTNARWTKTPIADGGIPLCDDASEPFRTDFRQGVRVITLPQEVLPFVYSCTNFTGLAGTTAASVAKVEIVKLEGEGGDVTAWQPVGNVKTLVQASDEGAVVWKVKTGVWKATFTILTDAQAKLTETAYFDCRAVKGPGLAIFIR